MFKNRHLQVKMMQDGEETGESVNSMIVLNMILEDHLKDMITGVITIMVARKVLNTACDLVIIRAGR